MIREAEREATENRRAVTPGIRTRLLRTLLPLLLLVLALAAVVGYRTSIVPVEAAYDQALADAALAVSAQLRLERSRLRLDLSEQSLSMLRADTEDQIFFRVIGPDGQTVAGDVGLEGPMPPAQRAFFDARYRGRKIRGLAASVENAAGTSIIVIAETTRKRDRARRELIITHVAAVLGVMLLALLAVGFSTEAALRPVDRLVDDARKRSPSDLQPLPEGDAPGEVRPLITAINRLFLRIRETQDSQRRFVENAAHQLRTPLAGLRGQLDLAVADAREATTQPDRLSSLRGRLDALRRASERITHLSHQLLTLARTERASHVAANLQLVQLEDLVVEAVAASIDRALARGHDLGAETSAVSVRAVGWELRELLANLIDNAIRYTPDGGRITVRCARRGDMAVLEVEDSGPGIAPSERERVFERFYRPSATSEEGSGLGLAIVRDIARLYDGEVTIEQAVDAGALVTVWLPISASA